MTPSDGGKRVAVWVGIVLVVTVLSCVSPYLLVFVNSFLNGLLGEIPTSDYLNYIADFLAGAISVPISLYALHISRLAERREQARDTLELVESKRALKEYIVSCCHSFYEVYRDEKSCGDLNLPDWIQRHLHTLSINGVLGEDERHLCESMHAYQMSAMDPSRSEPDSSLAARFRSEFLDTTSPDYLQNASVLRIIEKLQEGESQNDSKAK